MRKKYKEENTKVGIKTPNVLGLKATEAAYQEAGDWFEELMKLLNKNVDRTIDSLKEIDSRYQVMRPEASFLVWVNIEEFEVTNQEFMNELEKNDLYLTNGELYGEEGKGWVRMNIGMPTKALECNLQRFSQVNL